MFRFISGPRRVACRGAAALSAIALAAVVLVVATSGIAGVTPALVATPSTNLTDGEVVQVSGSGLQPSTSFSLRQCTVGGCAAVAAVPASSDLSGVMSSTPFTVQRVITVAGSPVDCGGGTGCGIVAIWGGPTVSTPITFAPVLVPALVATPSTNLTDSQVVQVSGSGLQPSTSFSLRQCTVGGCAAVAAVPASSNASGVMSSTPFTVQRVITVGGSPVDCGGGTGCGIVAIWGGPPVSTPITFASVLIPALVATPSTNLTDSQVVQVSGSGLQPSTSFSLRQCTLGACAAVAAVPASSNASGVMSSTPFTVQRVITVGGSPVDCGGGTGCGIVAIWGGPPVSTPITFAPVVLVPASVTLSPPDATNVVGTTHTVTATVRDQNGAPLPGITVRVSVSGSVSANGSCVSVGDGTCDVSYEGPDFPGADAIVAYADSDDDGNHDSSEPSAEATKAWVLPPSTTGHVTGGGQVLNAAGTDEVAFGFDAKNASNGPKGGCNLVDLTAANTKVRCLDVTSMVVNGTSATIWGSATVNGVAASYRIDVIDNGEPGTSDSFRITTSSGYAAGGTLRRGNIQTH